MFAIDRLGPLAEASGRSLSDVAIHTSVVGYLEDVGEGEIRPCSASPTKLGENFEGGPFRLESKYPGLMRKCLGSPGRRAKY